MAWQSGLDENQLKGPPLVWGNVQPVEFLHFLPTKTVPVAKD